MHSFQLTLLLNSITLQYNILQNVYEYRGIWINKDDNYNRAKISYDTQLSEWRRHQGVSGLREHSSVKVSINSKRAARLD